jgi:hypothetical protein
VDDSVQGLTFEYFDTDLNEWIPIPAGGLLVPEGTLIEIRAVYNTSEYAFTWAGDLALETEDAANISVLGDIFLQGTLEPLDVVYLPSSSPSLWPIIVFLASPIFILWWSLT